MEGFKKGFYTTSLKKERKPEANLGQSSYTQPQPFSQQSQQYGIQQSYGERKQTQKSTHVLISMSEEKPIKQAKSALPHKDSEFNPSGQFSMEQLIKVALNLQEEVKKLRKNNEKLIQQINIAERIESRLMSQKREQEPFETYHKVRIANPKISFRNRLNWITNSEQQKRNCKHLRKSKEKLELYNGNRSLKRVNPTRKIIKNQKEMLSAEAYDIFIGSVANFNRNKETIGQESNKIRKKKKSE